MKKAVIFLIYLFSPLFMLAQSGDSFGIKWAGFVKNDMFFDSRQTVSARQGHFLLYPAAEIMDPEGEDINARSSLHFLSIQTRLKGIITGPDVLGAKSSGLIEAAFFGNIEQNINSFRLRHAIVKLAWPTTELMAGQFWHPLFVTDCFPGTVSFNTGAPFQPFARNPQLRLSQSIGKLRLIGTLITQMDFVSNGPDGPSTAYLRNAVIPEMNLRAEFKTGNGNGTNFLVGVSGNYKKLHPRLSTELGYKANGSVENVTGMAYMKLQIPKITFKIEGVYGQDLFSMTMLGGYAVKNVMDLDTDIRQYTPINTMSLWGEIHSNGKLWQFGVFGGYSENLGSDYEIMAIPISYEEGTGEFDLAQKYYSRGSNISYVYRVAPRIVYSPGRMRFAGEIEYTAAAYGTPDSHGVVQNTTEVGNLRFLLATYIFF